MFQPGMCTFCLLLCGSLWASAQGIPARDSLALELALQQMEQHPALRSATWSFSLLDPGGTPVAMRRPEKTLAPASVLKLLSTAAALDQLGPGHRFPTRMAWSGRLEGGTLYGTLWLIGGGDPSLGSKRGGLPGLEATLSSMVKACRQAGIWHIEGQVLGDGRLYGQPAAPASWCWDDLGNYYAPVLNALCLDENRFSIRYQTPAEPGRPARLIAVEPELPGWLFTHDVLSGEPGSRDETYVYAAPGLRTISLQGTLPPGRSDIAVRGAWPDPELAAAQHLLKALEAAGLTVSGGAAAASSSATLPPPPTPSLQTIWQHNSPPLAQLVQWTNEQSLNLHAEMLLLALNSRAAPDAAPTHSPQKQALQVLENWLREGPGARGEQQQLFEAWSLHDGSGLSLRNAVTAEGMSHLLYWASLQPWAADWQASLPRSGQSGTMRRIASHAPGRIAAKTGTLGNVRAYAGYVQGKGGSAYPFCLLINHSSEDGEDLSQALNPFWDAMLALP